MFNKTKAHIIHFGCRLNQYETDALYAAFCDAKIEMTQKIEQADYVILNTCTVTNVSDYKSRAAIRKVQRKNPKAKIVITGCYATTDKSFLLEKFPDVMVVPNTEKAYIVQNLTQEKLKLAFEREKRVKDSSVFDYNFRKKSGHVRAYLKIQDGCNKKCSYCKIPQARGSAISRNFYDCVRELKYLVSEGFAEISITGVNIGTYYSEGYNFTELIRALVDIKGQFFLRISSIEPPDVNEDFMALFDLEKVAQFAHIPLQTGSQSVLKQMHRGYTLSSFTKKIKSLRNRFPYMHIGTDLIVGFPGESENNFEETLQYIEDIKFDNIHFFPFSKRKGTSVVSMLGKKKLTEVDGDIIKKRIQRLRTIQDKIVQKRLEITENRPYRGTIISKTKTERYNVLTENYVKIFLDIAVDKDAGDLVFLTYSKEREAILL